MSGSSFQSLYTAEDGISFDDFYAYMPLHSYIHVPTGSHWPGSSVNSRLPDAPLLDANGQPVLDERTESPKAIRPTCRLIGTNPSSK